MISIHRASTEDFPAVMTLLAEARAAIARLGIDQWQDGYPEAEVIRADIEAQIGFVLKAGAAVAGYFALQSAAEPAYAHIDGAWRSAHAPYLTVHRMAASDAHRGQGLGKRMLAFAEAEARRMRLPSVRVDTHRGNRVMRGLLEKCGYAYCGEVRYQVSAGDPIRVAYERCLEET